MSTHCNKCERKIDETEIYTQITTKEISGGGGGRVLSIEVVCQECSTGTLAPKTESVELSNKRYRLGVQEVTGMDIGAVGKPAPKPMVCGFGPIDIPGVEIGPLSVAVPFAGDPAYQGVAL